MPRLLATEKYLSQPTAGPQVFDNPKATRSPPKARIVTHANIDELCRRLEAVKKGTQRTGYAPPRPMTPYPIKQD